MVCSRQSGALGAESSGQEAVYFKHVVEDTHRSRSET